MKITKRLNLFLIPLFIGFCLYNQPIAKAGSILIWPIDPVIEDDQNATALWLENKDSKPAYMQIRVLEWQQLNGENQYQKQNDIAVSPPFVLIEPGKRQLVRLIKNTQVPANQERAYRILIDEAPRAKKADEPDDSKNVSIGVKFQMRYSVPLFVSGSGVWTNPDYTKNRDIKTATAPKLSYRLTNQNGQPSIEIRNEGIVHARLSQLSTQSGTTLVNGLLGYVLPGTTINLPLPGNINSGNKLQALINNNPDPVPLIRH
ncbi:fimbrial biogenesis chaperone [Pragia fontium]|uniref:Fimbrial chaperone protein n=1 Tax=Pragia fontium DSM 5563 = ATCC 49100 TaxID=1122977 RepID=A0AAJ4WAR0_9GAMM|nr:molecular chaperone [Pragia fontium]SFC87044.1 fimbrial chaperone protein [Pragia fontium DSM 5563 = ATCC 49100]VEJ56085.1 putative fimbrial chaperone protein [Pragia fontium]